MGLLDDAIREHLELKRLHGADPGLVAREEHEAFGSTRGGDAPASADADGNAPVDLGESAGEDVTWIDDDNHMLAPSSGDARADEAHAEGAHTDGAQDLSSVSQETAELDMRSVLEEEPDHGHASIGRGEALDETDLPHDIPGQEQLFEQRPSQDFGFDE